jgi:hypothetical protein
MIRNRRLRAVLCILLLAVVLAASVTWAAHLLDHHCTGEDCPVCARLIRVGGGLRSLPGIWLTWAVILGVGLFAAVRRRPGALPSARTPVSLGVRLLN